MDPGFKKVAGVVAKAAAGATTGAVGGAVVGAVGGPVGAAVVGVLGGVGGGLLGAAVGLIDLFRLPNVKVISDESWRPIWNNASKKLEEMEEERYVYVKQSRPHSQEARTKKMREDYKRAIQKGTEVMSCGRVAIIGETSERLRQELMVLPPTLATPQDTNAVASKPDLTKGSAQCVYTISNKTLCPMTKEEELKGLAALANKVMERNSEALLSSLKKKVTAIFSDRPNNKHSDSSSGDKSTDDIMNTIIKKIVEGTLEQTSSTSCESITTPVLIHATNHRGSWEQLKHILPILITSRSFFVIAINSEETYGHYDTIMLEEDVCQLITSIIDALSEKAKELFVKLQKSGVTSVSGIHVCPYPKILVVGTFISDEQHAQIQSKVENIRRWVNMYCSDSVQHNFKAIVVNASYETVVNVADIKENMTNFIASDLKIQTPLSWELFRQIFSYLTKNIPIMQLENVATIASFCDINHDFISVLNFYHEHGAFLYYPDVQYLNEIIIIDPKWLQEKLHMILTPKADQSSPIWQWHKKGILIDPHCENPEKIEKLQDGLMMLLEKYHLAAPIHINQEICDLKGPKYFVPFLLKSKRTSQPLQKKSELHTAPLHFIFPKVKHLPSGVFTKLIVALAVNKHFKMDFVSEIFSNQITYWFGKYDKVILAASLTSIYVVVERLKYCGDDYPASNFGSTCQKIFILLTTEIQKLFKTSCPAFCCECLPEGLPHYVTISTDTENTCGSLRCDKGKLYIFKDCEQLWLKMAAPSHTVGKVFKREIHSLGLQPEDLVKVTRALEITPIDPDTDSKFLISWWSEEMGADARKHLMYHLKRLGMAKAAQAISRGLYCEEGIMVRDDKYAGYTIPDAIKDVCCDVYTIRLSENGCLHKDDHHGFSLDFPSGILLPNQSITLTIGVMVYGPFKFPEGLRPISPILWILSDTNVDLKLLKDAKVILPHYLDIGEQDDKEFEILFMKAAIYHYYTINDKKQKYIFESMGNATLLNDRKAAFSTNHFCSLCLAAKVSESIKEKSEYCMTIFIDTTNRMYTFVVSYCLETCTETLKKHFSSVNKKTNFNFKCTSSSLTIGYSDVPQWILSLIKGNTIELTDLDICNADSNKLKWKENEGLYFPSFVLQFDPANASTQSSKVLITFPEITRQIELPLLVTTPPVSSEHCRNSSTSIVQDQKPDLKRIHTLKILNWHGVGLQLGLDKYCLDIIGRDHPQDDNRQKVEMLSKWLQQDLNATYGKLAMALLAVGEAACAEQLARGIGFVLNSTACSTSSALPHDSVAACGSVSAPTMCGLKTSQRPALGEEHKENAETKISAEHLKQHSAQIIGPPHMCMILLVVLFAVFLNYMYM